jgi:hypothetical protein
VAAEQQQFQEAAQRAVTVNSAQQALTAARLVVADRRQQLAAAVVVGTTAVRTLARALKSEPRVRAALSRCEPSALCTALHCCAAVAVDGL